MREKSRGAVVNEWFRLTMALTTVFVAMLCVQSAFGDQCPPSVRISGNSELIENITEILNQRGIETEPADRCPLVTAWVKKTEDKVKVIVEDSQKRRKQMIAADVAEAVTFIESWALSQVGLEFSEPSPVTLEPIEPKPRPTQSPAERKKKPTFFIGGGPEALLGFDDDPSFWIGGNIVGCGQVGPVCIGGLGRYMQDLGISTEADDFDLTRQGAEGMATLEMPLQFGHLKIRPGFGLGLGWMRTEGTGEPAVNSVEKGKEVFDTWGFIGQVHFSMSGSIKSTVDAGGRMFFRPSLPAETDDFVREGRQLPGEPWGFVGLSLFLEYSP